MEAEEWWQNSGETMEIMQRGGEMVAFTIMVTKCNDMMNSYGQWSVVMICSADR